MNNAALFIMQETTFVSNLIIFNKLYERSKIMLSQVQSINSVMWGPILITLLCGTGILYTFRLKFIQVRKFGTAWKMLFKNFSLSGKKSEKGEMTPFQAISTAIAAQVGTGNITGAATALISGGPGAIFWM